MLGLLLMAVVATACGDSGGSIEVEDARYRLSRTDLGAGYLSVTNSTGDPVTLLGASAEGVGRIELHESMAAADGTMSMEARPQGFTIAAGETVTLEPGGKHLMLFDPQSDVQDLTIELDFGDETVQVVAEFDEAASAAASDESMGEMGDMEDPDMEDGDS